MTGSAALSPADIAALAANPSASNRAAIAAKLAGAFDRAPLTPAERRLAEDIFRALVRDVEVMVRHALAENLKTCEQVPRDLALALANDVAQVAAPMLEFSA